MAYVQRASQTGQGAAQVIKTQRADFSGLQERIDKMFAAEREAIQAQQEAESMSAKADAYADTLLPPVKAKFKRDINDVMERAKSGKIKPEDFDDVIDVTYNANLDLNNRMWNYSKNAPKTNESYVKVVDGGIKPATFGLEDLMFNPDAGKSGDLEKDIAEYENSLLPKPKSSYSDLMNSSINDAFDTYAQKNTELEIPEGADEKTYKSIVKQDWGVVKAKQLAEGIADDPNIQYSYLFENYPERLLEVSQSGEMPDDIYNEILTQAENSLKPRTQSTEKKLPQGRDGGSKTEIATANKVKELVNKFQDTKNPEAISQFLKPYGLTMQVDGDEVMLNSVQVESKDGEQTSKVKVLASGLDINNADEIYAALANNVGDISLDALGKVEFEDRTKGVSVPEATTEQKQEIEDLLKKGTVPSWINEEDIEIVSSQFSGGEPQKIKFKGEVYDITDEKQAEDLFLKVQNERPIKEQDSKPNNEPEIGTTSDLPD